MATAESRRQIGRPSQGLGVKGEPKRISDYPKLAITVRPAVRARLNAIAAVENRPAWKIVEDGINLYAAKMPRADRRIVDDITWRVVEGKAARQRKQT